MISFIRRCLGRGQSTSLWDSDKPIREELFSIERLEEHARSLAVAQSVSPKLARGHSLAKRLSDNSAALLNAHRATAQAIDEGGAITPAAEWLVDNYHVVEKQLHDIRSHLPPSYYRRLPKLVDGPFAGYPRVLGVAWAFVAHTDSRFDAETLARYVRAYQEIQLLTIGELWAVAITLKIVLVENLRRLADRITHSRAARREADSLANQLLDVEKRNSDLMQSSLVAYEVAPLSDAFSLQLLYRLRDQDPVFTPALIWLDERLAKVGTTVDAVVRDEHQRQGAATVTVRNIITSMRLISDVDWSDLFERMSLVDGVLAAGSRFLDMDFPTRNLYRNVVEELALGSGSSELDIARGAVIAGKQRSSTGVEGADERQSDPGYYLLGSGRPAFETTVGFEPPFRTRLGRLGRALGIGGYTSAIISVAAAFLALALFALSMTGLGSGWLCMLGALGAISAIDAAVALVNRGVMWRFGATPLPGLELRGGVPAHLRTLIVVPMLLTTREAIEEQVERLEVHYLASPEGELHFALLSDWLDATTKHAANDVVLLSVAMEGIDRLNQRYGATRGGDRFLLFHRRRVWNDSERRWIGWERKRGKLHELNRFLRGSTNTTFLNVKGRPLTAIEDVRYVITLDADTKLPRDTVRRLIGKIAHPLNRPVIDAVAGRVVEGYAVLQPRVAPSLPVGREGSLFQRIFSSAGGIDPYASAASDVYQDLFGEGSYTGKGIYEIDAFEAVLAGRVPDSTLLSHDLFEGVFARAGLASDVEVVEEFPARYDIAAMRQHRWARGDWQLLPLILRPGSAPGAVQSRNGVTWVGRWKMVDNIRRTLSAPAATVALIVGLVLPVHAAFVWTGFVLATIVLPTLGDYALFDIRRSLD